MPAVDPRMGAIQPRDVASAITEDFTALYNTYAPRLIEYGISALQLSKSDAFDLVQDIFSRLWAQRTTWRPVRDMASYLYSALRNARTNVIRDHATHDRLTRAWHADPSATRMVATPAHELLRSEQRQIMMRIVDTLPERYREAFMLYHDHGYKFRQIATVMDISEKSAKKYFTTAMHRISDALQQAGYP